MGHMLLGSLAAVARPSACAGSVHGVWRVRARGDTKGYTHRGPGSHSSMQDAHAA